MLHFTKDQLEEYEKLYRSLGVARSFSEGDFCRRCKHPVVKCTQRNHKATKQNKSLKTGRYYKWWFKCTACGWLFLPNEAKSTELRKMSMNFSSGPVLVLRQKPASTPTPELKDYPIDSGTVFSPDEIPW